MVRDIQGDARRVWETLQKGGVGIIALDVSYAFVAQTGAAAERTFDAKGRSATKPMGSIGSLEIMREVQVLTPRCRDIASALVEDYGLPFSPVAPFRADHPFMKRLDPLALARSTKGQTLDMLINAGPLHNALAKLAWEHQQPILGSSANKSLSGSKFRLEDIEPEVLAAADVTVDYGLCRYHNPEAVGSTILVFPQVEVLRFGVAYEHIRDILKRHFRIELPPRPAGDITIGAARG